MINVIMIVLMVSSDSITVLIVVGWVVVVSLGSYVCWGGDKTYFRGIVLESYLYCASLGYAHMI